LGEAGDLIVVEPTNMTKVTRKLNPLKLIIAPAFLFAGPKLFQSFLTTLAEVARRPFIPFGERFSSWVRANNEF